MVKFSQLRSEFKRITWPGPKEVAKKTGITLLVCVIMSLIIGLFDLFFNWIIRGLENLFI